MDAATLSSCFLGVRSPKACGFVAPLCLAVSSKLNPKRKPQSTAQGYGKAVSKYPVIWQGIPLQWGSWESLRTGGLHPLPQLVDLGWCSHFLSGTWSESPGHLALLARLCGFSAD